MSKSYFISKVVAKLSKTSDLSDGAKKDFEARQKGLAEIEKLIEDYRKSGGNSQKLRQLEDRMKLFCGLE